MSGNNALAGTLEQMTRLKKESFQISPTDNLDFACFLLAASRLPFKGVRAMKGRASRTEFLFEDPDNQIDTLEAEFSSGAQVSAITMLSSFRQLRRSMDRIKSGANSNGEHRRSYPTY